MYIYMNIYIYIICIIYISIDILWEELLKIFESIIKKYDF